MVPANFEYSALSSATSIRILILLPAPSLRDRINCSLKEISLEEKTPADYEALSYVWGDSERTKKIHIRASSDPARCYRHFRATRNLEAALRYLRLRTEERVLWIDAVCINQHDGLEKALQVQMMGRIFSSACNVIVWLGRLYEKIRRAPSQFFGDERKGFDLVSQNYRRSPKDIPATFAWFRKFEHLYGQHVGPEQELHDAIMGDRSLRPKRAEANGFRILKDRPWFSRVWVMQEVVLARNRVTIQCAEYTVPLKAFLTAHEYLGRGGGDLSGMWGQTACRVLTWSKVHVLNVALSRFKSPHFAGLPIPDRVVEALMLVGLRLTASRPHDVLYGMLGMIGDTGDMAILKPNYEKPIRHLLIELVRYLIQASGTLRILQGGYGRKPLDVNIVHPPKSMIPFRKSPPPQESISNLPSWIPTGKMHRFQEDFVYANTPALRHATHLSFSADGHNLNITALSLGSLSQILPEISQDSGPQVRSRVEQAILADTTVMQRYGSHDAVLDALIRIYHSRYFPAHSSVEDDDDDDDDIHIKRENYDAWLARSPSFDDSASPFVYIDNIRMELFTTSEGYIGGIRWDGEYPRLSSQALQMQVLAGYVDTRVVYVPGCVWPFIIGRGARDGGVGGENYQIWRNCIVPGLIELKEKEHIAMFDDGERLETFWIE